MSRPEQEEDGKETNHTKNDRNSLIEQSLYNTKYSNRAVEKHPLISFFFLLCCFPNMAK